MKKSNNIVIKLSSNLLKPGNDIIEKLGQEISILKDKGYNITWTYLETQNRSNWTD